MPPYSHRQLKKKQKKRRTYYIHVLFSVIRSMSFSLNSDTISLTTEQKYVVLHSPCSAFLKGTLTGYLGSPRLFFFFNMTHKRLTDQVTISRSSNVRSNLWRWANRWRIVNMQLKRSKRTQ